MKFLRFLSLLTTKPWSKTRPGTKPSLKPRQKRLAVAKAGGFRLGRLLSIEEGSTPIYYGYETMKSAGLGSEAASPTIEAGSQEITITMTLRYEIQ